MFEGILFLLRQSRQSTLLRFDNRLMHQTVKFQPFWGDMHPNLTQIFRIGGTDNQAVLLHLLQRHADGRRRKMGYLRQFQLSKSILLRQLAQKRPVAGCKPCLLRLLPDTAVQKPPYLPAQHTGIRRFLPRTRSGVFLYFHKYLLFRNRNSISFLTN